MATLKQLVDETANIKNELIACHTDLKTNLIDKGVEVKSILEANINAIREVL